MIEMMLALKREPNSVKILNFIEYYNIKKGAEAPF